jgi:uncharacterized hydrophobic protein (TIGR00271 family)
LSVLVLINDDAEALSLVRIAQHFARATERELYIGILGRSSSEAKFSKLEDLLQGDISPTSLISKIGSLGTEIEGFSPQVAVLCLKKFKDHIRGIAESCSASLLIVGYHASSVIDIGVVQKIFVEADCDTLVLRLGANTDFNEIKTILVPVVGGPHSLVALRYGEQLARQSGKMVALYVEPNVDDAYQDVGKNRLQYFMQLAGLEPAEHIELRVELSNDVAGTISQVASENFDLVVIGSSQVGSIRRNLFGTISQKLMTGPDGTALGVLRSRKPFIRRFRESIENVLDLVIPQLQRPERVALFEEIEVKSKWNFDFLVLIVLSTIIASLGLLQNSGAVVIGAMLVAPLMTPLLGIGLAVLQENILLYKNSSYAVVFGFLAAFFSSAFVGLVVSDSELSAQMLARTSPSLLDIAVGYLSGLAAAHCISRPGLSAALPGVAIAAALVPPIATSGISFAMGQYSHTLGAFLLFFTNVVAIVIGAASSFFGAGVRPRPTAEAFSSWTWRVSSILALLLVSLVLLYAQHPRYHSRSLPPLVMASLQNELSPQGAIIETADLVRGESEEHKVILALQSPKPISMAESKRLVSLLSEGLGAGVELELKTHLSVKLISALRREVPTPITNDGDNHHRKPTAESPLDR